MTLHRNMENQILGNVIFLLEVVLIAIAKILTKTMTKCEHDTQKIGNEKF